MNLICSLMRIIFIKGTLIIVKDCILSMTKLPVHYRLTLYNTITSLRISNDFLNYVFIVFWTFKILG
jgi:hypothetical protein